MGVINVFNTASAQMLVSSSDRFVLNSIHKVESQERMGEKIWSMPRSPLGEGITCRRIFG